MLIILEDSQMEYWQQMPLIFQWFVIPDYLPDCKEVLARTSAVLPSLVEVKNELWKFWGKSGMQFFVNEMNLCGIKK